MLQMYSCIFCLELLHLIGLINICMQAWITASFRLFYLPYCFACFVSYNAFIDFMLVQEKLVQEVNIM